MRKKTVLTALCLMLAFSLSGCAAVNSENSFQGQAPSGISVQQEGSSAGDTQQTAQTTLSSIDQADEQVDATLPDNAAPTAEPTKDPSQSGYNG